MRIHSISKILVIPLLILVAIVYILTSYVDRDYSILIVVPVILGVVLYIFHGNLDYWYLKRNPVGLDPSLQSWLQKYFRPYQTMDQEERGNFEYRLELYLNARLFQAMGREAREVPEDFKAAIASYGVWMTRYMSDFLIGDFDRLFLYKHHFPSPSMPELHAVEVNDEDGVIILNNNLMADAILQPTLYYNIAIHAYAEAIEKTYGPYTGLDEEKGLEEVCGWSAEEICRQTGLPFIKPALIHVQYYFSFSERYRSLFPKQAIILDQYFNKPA